MVLASEDCESIENDDGSKVNQRKPGGVWLESAPEDERVAINSLSLECLVELDICDANRTPSEQPSNGSEILEPVEDQSWTTIGNGRISECRNGRCDTDTNVWNTGLGATEEEARCLLVLCESKKIS